MGLASLTSAEVCRDDAAVGAHDIPTDPSFPACRVRRQQLHQLL